MGSSSGPDPEAPPRVEVPAPFHAVPRPPRSPRSSRVWLVPVVLVFVVLAGLVLVRSLARREVRELGPSGVTVKGRAISYREIDEVAADFAARERNGRRASAGERWGEPQSRVGKRFKELEERSDAIDATFDAATEGMRTLLMVGPKRLTSPEGLRRSQEELRVLRMATGERHERLLTLYEDWARIVDEEFDQKWETLERSIAVNREMNALLSRIFDVTEKILALAERERFGLDPKTGELRFRRRATFDRYATLVTTYNALEEKVAALREKGPGIIDGT